MNAHYEIAPRKAGVKVNHLSGVMRWRCIGPFRGGRVVAVAGHPTETATFYFGAVAGGVWKTTDAGVYWRNVSDRYFSTGSVGAIAVSESDPNVIYVGTGESSIRNDVTHGDGVYKSTDGGETWRSVGLTDTRHIARVRVHPKNPDVVYVAALGHAFGHNEERGVFRSTDGGATWERVLFVSDGAGAIDLSMDPNNPRTMYASIWQVHRSFWDIVSGGPECGLYKTTDGGDTWVDLSERPGLPKETLGKIGVALSPARPGRVWALIEAENGGLFRSDDGGETWEHLSDDGDLRSRSWYYTHIFADPSDSETVWVLAAKTLKSTNGGRHFTEVSMPHGDQHDLWIDPRDSRRMIEGNDGGATVSLNGSETWSNIYNQPTAQLYHITTDNQFPYEVYGTQQDNSGMAIRSYSDSGAIHTSDWHTVGMSESGDIAVKPDDPSIVYSAYPHGILNRYDHRNREVRVVTVWPDDHMNWPPRTYKYRFAWKFPIVFSPHDADTLYVGGNMVFRTRDDGTTWEAISPDLTRNDETKMELKGGPITIEGADAEVYCTVYAFAESPIERDLLWAGTDDGLVHVSRDGGGRWKDVTPPTMPEWTMVHSIDPSPHDAATAYVAATRYKSDDFRPYLYKTNDYGETWQEIGSGIPDDDFTRVVREDPARRGLLYCGTESGVYVSADDGESWELLQCNLPVVPIHDLVVKAGDLVAGTHGRSIWIMDDLSPLHQLASGAPSTQSTPVQGDKAKPHLLRPRATYRMLHQAPSMGELSQGMKYWDRMLGLPAAFREEKTPDGRTSRLMLDAGENPPEGVGVVFYLPGDAAEDVSLTFLDSSGGEIKTFSSGGEGDEALSVSAGMNRFTWDMRYPGARRLSEVEGGYKPKELGGILAPPGRYRVRLTAGHDTFEEPFDLLKDPRSGATQEALDAQFELLIKIRDRLSDVHEAAQRIRRIRAQVDAWGERASSRPEAQAISESAKLLTEKLSAIESDLVAMKPPPGSLRGEVARLNGRLVTLAGVVASADWTPPNQAREVFAELSEQVDERLRELQQVVDTDVAAFARLLQDSGTPTIAS